MKFSQKLNGHIIPEKQTLITKRTKIFAFCLFHARQIKRELKVDKFSNLPNNSQIMTSKKTIFYSDVPCFVPFLDTNTLINFRYDKG